MKTSRFYVDVTQADIDVAICEDSHQCVVARAVQRTVPEAKNIEVDFKTVRFTYRGKRLVYSTPWQVTSYVIAFDAGEPIEPFRFGLYDPLQVHRRLMTKEGRVVQRERARRQYLRKKGLPMPTEPLPKATGPVMVSDKAGKRPPARAFKKRKRNYGVREMRINKAGKTDTVPMPW